MQEFLTMADNKLTDLTSIADAAAGDLLYIVDVSDTTDGAGGSSRKISAENLLETVEIGNLQGTSGVLTLPVGADTLVGRATTDTLTNKTLTYPVISSIDASTLTIIPSGAGVDAVLKVESDDTGDRADLQLVGHDSTNNGDQFLFSLRTDLADVTMSAYDASATTYHQILEFDYLSDYIHWGSNTNIHAAGAYNTASAQNQIVLQHKDSSDAAGTTTTGIIFEIDADDWDGTADKHARIFAERTADFANNIALVLSTYSGGALNERLRIDEQVTSQVQFNVDTIGEDTSANGVVIDSLRIKDGGPTGWDGWQIANETWTYASATTITVPSDATTKYSVGDKVRIKQGGGYKYFYIVTVASTLLTVTGGSNYTVANASITDNYYSKGSTPFGHPIYFDYTPTITAGSGSFTTVTPNGKFAMNGKVVSYWAKATITTNGTAGGSVNFSLPVTATSDNEIGVGRQSAVGGGIVQVILATTTRMDSIKYDNTYPGGDGEVINCNITYAAA